MWHMRWMPCMLREIYLMPLSGFHLYSCIWYDHYVSPTTFVDHCPTCFPTGRRSIGHTLEWRKLFSNSLEGRWRRLLRRVLLGGAALEIMVIYFPYGGTAWRTIEDLQHGWRRSLNLSLHFFFVLVLFFCVFPLVWGLESKNSGFV
jgi:hypothetical protein